MVTILEPKVDIPVEPALPPRESQRRGRAMEWRYSMPFAGVRYYSFRPERVSESKADVTPLAVKLIDERVFLL